MADLTYDIKVNSTDAERNLTNLQTRVAGLTSTFDKLRGALASIAFGAAINNALQFADAISDLSSASEIAVSNIIGFSKAVEANGGSADGAQKAILRLVNSIGEAADGSASMQQAFADVNVTINDLRTASNQDILKKTIDGLDKMENSAKRSVLVTQLLGKEFRNVATGQLGAAYAAATDQSLRYATAITSAGQANDNIVKAIGTLKLELINLLKPLSDFVNTINVSSEAVGKFFDILGTFLKGAAILVGLTLIGRAIYVIGTAAIAAYGAITEITGGIIGLFRALTSAGTRSALFENLSMLSGGLGQKVIVVLQAMGVNTAFLAKHWLSLTAAIGGAIAVMADWMGLTANDPRENFPGRGAASEIANREAAAAKEKELREVLDKQAQIRSKIGLQLQHDLDNLAISLSRQTEAIALEARLIELSKLSNTLSEDQVEIIKAQSDAGIQRLATIKKIEQENEKLTQSLKFAKDEEKAGIEAQIAANNKLKASTEEYYKVHNDSLEYNITKLQTARKLDAARLQDMENMKKAIEDQIARQQTLGETLQKINDQRKDVEFQGSTIGMGSLEKEIATIQENARKAAMEAGRAYAAAFEDTGDGMTPERAQEFADGLAKITEGYTAIANSQLANLESSRTWEAGWNEAFKNYVDDATNAATMAKEAFSSMTSNMNSALDKFVETGKLNFGDLARSIIQDLLKIQLRKAAAGFLGSLFGIPGMAMGGPVDAGMPYVIGEQGPELFVPKNSGTIIPNHKLGGGTIAQPAPVVNNYNYSISAIDAKSVSQLFYENRQTLFGTVEAAKKELPFRR